MITVYVLRGSKRKRYVGITNNLPRRLDEHSSGQTKTGQIIVEFEVLHTEGFSGHATAREREKFLKSGQGRKWLDELEQRTRPAEGG